MMDFTLNGESGFTHGIFLQELPNFPTSTRDVVFTDVQGREHGSLTRVYGWKDSEINLSLGAVDMKHIRKTIRESVGWFYGAKMISFSDDPTFFFKVKNVVIGDVENQLEVLGFFTVTMTIDPFQYQDVVPIHQTTNFELFNQGTTTSEPAITLYGNGQLEIVINGRRLKISNVTESVVINTEMQTAVSGTINKETDLTGDFPYFDVGLNTVTFTADNVVVEPNWRWLM